MNSCKYDELFDQSESSILIFTSGSRTKCKFIKEQQKQVNEVLVFLFVVYFKLVTDYLAVVVV